MKVIKHKPLHINRNLYDKALVFVQNLHKNCLLYRRNCDLDVFIKEMLY